MSQASSRPTAGQPAESGDLRVIRVHDVSSDDLIELYGRVMTAPDGTLKISEYLRDFVLLTENGELLISRSHKDDPHVLSFESRIRQQGFQVGKRYYVDIKTISEAYASAESDNVSRLKLSDTANMRELLRIVRVAAEKKASDIHLVVENDTARVRMRIDGVVYDIEEMTASKGLELCGTAFSMADNADASYSPYEYQGARISQQSADLPRAVQSLRVQWNPIAFGGRFMVMRLLYSTAGGQQTNAPSDLAILGYRDDQLAELERIRAQPMGINIIAGPVNSGKSTTVAITLDVLLRESNYERTCLTVEDPPEFIITGAQQMPVTNAKTSKEKAAKFQLAIEAALRSDPNIILIGEIRGPESASHAFQGAMTGTQVWASLHANTALGIIDRLRDMGIEDYKLADPTIMTGLIGQRLLKVLCPDCRITLDQAERSERIALPRAQRARETMQKIGHGDATIYCRGRGCETCKHIGYKGRTAASEIIHPDETFMEHIRAGDKVKARHHWLRDMGGYTMLTHALHKMIAGHVGPEEVEAAVDLLHADADTLRHFHALQQGS